MTLYDIGRACQKSSKEKRFEAILPLGHFTDVAVAESPSGRGKKRSKLRGPVESHS